MNAVNLCRCFPIVPKLACRHLEIPLTGGDRPLTLLGGLTSFGGAGNNYSMHVSFLQPLQGPPSDYLGDRGDGEAIKAWQWNKWTHSCQWRHLNISICTLSLEQTKI